MTVGTIHSGSPAASSWRPSLVSTSERRVTRPASSTAERATVLVPRTVLGCGSFAVWRPVSV